MTDRPPSPFQLARDQLRAIGVQLDSLPGEYRVNLRGAGPETAYFTADLAEAIDYGRAMVASRPHRPIIVCRGSLPARADNNSDPAVVADARAEALILVEKPPRRKWRRRKMTPKAFNRRLRKQHMRRLRAKAIKEQQKDA